MTSTSSRRSCASRAGLPGLLALLALLCPSVGIADDDAAEPAVFPLESEGQLRFFVDCASYRGDGGATDFEVYASISNDQLELREAEDGTWHGRIRLDVALEDEDGAEVFRTSSTLEPAAKDELDAEDRAIVQVLREMTTATPGRYRLRVQLTDEYGLRTGILNRIRRANRQGSVDGPVDVRAFEPDSLRVSDLTMIRGWEVTGGEAVFGRHGVDFDPNPARQYGLVLPVARFYLEVYAGENYEPGDTFFLQAQVVDGAGLPRAEKASRAVPREGMFVVTEQIPLTDGIDAGSYRLDVTVLSERSRRSVRTSAGFEVIWAVQSWGKDPETMLQEMALIMTDSEYQTLKKLTPGAQEAYLAEYWHGLDPDPTTAGNPIFDAFQARVRRADREFAATLHRGIRTDRGRVYVRYGPPDDVVYEYSTSGFGSEGFGERIADPAERADLVTRPSTSFLDPDEFREGDIGDAGIQRGGANVKSKQIEVWVYDGPGYPLTDHVDRGSDSHRGLKFIFADEMGDGNYALIGSSGARIF